ncbi:MAG: DUF4124 domain-containing protein [Nitrosomonas sp. PRO4]|nr:DUF4124 domain-containing protein [Nitrosomonas sp. PRO4]
MKIQVLFIISIVLPLVLFSSVSAGTEIYKYVDKDGNITFTNRRISNAQKISIASFSRNNEQSGLRSTSPRVKDSTQKERDAMRRQILEKELVTEEKLLTDTQNFLEEIRSNSKSGNYQERVVQLQNKLFLHQRNIAALKKELTKL